MTTLIIQTATPKRLPRIRILTVEDLFNDKGIDMPKSVPGQTFKQAKKVWKQEEGREARGVGDMIWLF